MGRHSLWWPSLPLSINGMVAGQRGAAQQVSEGSSYYSADDVSGGGAREPAMTVASAHLTAELAHLTSGGVGGNQQDSKAGLCRR
jgi:hypothetical protein